MCQRRWAVTDEWHSLIGVEFAGLRLTECVGIGGQAAVFVGVNDADMGEIRAVKLVAPHLARDELFKKRLLQEAQLLKALKSKNIVNFYNVRIAPAMRGALPIYNGERFIGLELELLRGRSLQDVIDSGADVDGVDVLQWAAQAADGLAAAHAMGVIHRDVKPGNIFLCDDGTVKVIDFGIARAVSLADADSGGRLTRTGNMAGTSLYMAPELWKGTPPSPTNDIYALGLTVAYMVLGRHPFFSSDGEPPHEAAVMMGHLRDDLKSSLVTREGRLPGPLESIILRLCSRTPSDRPPDGVAAAEELRQAAEELRQYFARLRTQALEITTAPSYLNFEVGMDSSGLTNPVGPAATPLEGVKLSAMHRHGVTLQHMLGAVPLRRWLLVGALAFAALTVTVGVGFAAMEIDGEWLVGPAEPGEHQLRPPVDPPRADAGPVAPAVAVEQEPAPPVDPPTAAIDDPNPFVLVEAHESPVILGLPEDATGSGVRFSSNPDHQLRAPEDDFRIQQHEVTWGEVRAWLLAAVTGVSVPDGALDDLPATGLSWEQAMAYCESLACPGDGCSLPTEAQWEFAARGIELRPLPWGHGNARDANVYRGRNAVVSSVHESTRDETPTDPPIRHLLGNVMEWTRDIYRGDDLASAMLWENVGANSNFTFYVLRGLPLRDSSDEIQSFPSAYRSKGCAGGACSNTFADETGFRCVSPPEPVAPSIVPPLQSEVVPTQVQTQALSNSGEGSCRAVHRGGGMSWLASGLGLVLALLARRRRR